MSKKDLQMAISSVKEVIGNIDPEADYMTIVDVDDEITQQEEARRAELEDASTKTKGQLKILESARASCTRPASVPSAEAHIRNLNKLDALRISSGKAITDSEQYLGSKEAELSALKEEARALEDFDAATEHEKELDGTALRMEVYKGLGFEPILENHTEKILAKTHSGDIHCITFVDSYSDLEYASSLWKLAAS